MRQRIRALALAAAGGLLLVAPATMTLASSPIHNGWPASGALTAMVEPVAPGPEVFYEDNIRVQVLQLDERTLGFRQAKARQLGLDVGFVTAVATPSTPPSPATQTIGNSMRYAGKQVPI